MLRKVEFLIGFVHDFALSQIEVTYILVNVVRNDYGIILWYKQQN